MTEGADGRHGVAAAQAEVGEPEGADDHRGTDDAAEPLCDRARELGAGRPSGVSADRARSGMPWAERRSGRADGVDGRYGPDAHDEIVVLLRRAVALGEPSAPELLASAYLDRGERRRAVEVLTPAVHRDGRADLAGLLGEALAEIGDHEAAEATFLLGLDAADVSAMNGYGVFLWGRGRTQEAAYVLDRAARGGDELAPLNLVSLHLDELDDLVGASVIAAEFHDESRPSTLVALADVRLAGGRVDDAESLYRRAAELGAVCGHIYYAWFLQDRRDDLEAAEDHLRRAHDAGEPRAAYHVGRFLFDTGRLDEAGPWFEEAADRGDTDAEEVLEAEYRGLFDRYDD